MYQYSIMTHIVRAKILITQLCQIQPNIRQLKHKNMDLICSVQKKRLVKQFLAVNKTTYVQSHPTTDISKSLMKSKRDILR